MQTYITKNDVNKNVLRNIRSKTGEIVNFQVNLEDRQNMADQAASFIQNEYYCEIYGVIPLNRVTGNLLFNLGAHPEVLNMLA